MLMLTRYRTPEKGKMTSFVCDLGYLRKILRKTVLKLSDFLLHGMENPF